MSMHETITVDKAITRGHLILTLPTVLMIVLLSGLYIYLDKQNILHSWGIPCAISSIILLPWLWWSIMVTKWQLWAYANVRNVHELKKRAIDEKLIWDDNCIFKKTEIRSTSDYLKLEKLQEKFRFEDEFCDDPNVPEKTVIYYARAYNFIEMFFMIGFSIYGVYVFYWKDSPFFGCVLIVYGVILGMQEYKQATNKEPQIIISNEGIRTISTNFYKWSLIKNEEVIVVRSYRSRSSSYLRYNHPNGTEDIMIDDYDIDHKRLEKLLKVYRGRSKKYNSLRQK